MLNLGWALVAIPTETTGGKTRTRFRRARDRPEAEVLVDSVRVRGELRMWTRHTDGSWSANVTGSRGSREPVSATAEN